MQNTFYSPVAPGKFQDLYWKILYAGWLYRYFLLHLCKVFIFLTFDRYHVQEKHLLWLKCWNPFGILRNNWVFQFWTISRIPCLIPGPMVFGSSWSSLSSPALSWPQHTGVSLLQTSPCRLRLHQLVMFLQQSSIIKDGKNMHIE